MSGEPHQLRPNHRVFVVRSTVRAAILSFPLVLLLTAAAPVLDLGGGPAFGLGMLGWLAWVSFRFVERHVVYTKTRYWLFPDRIVLESGGLVSDRRVDLQFSNVTQAALTLPFIEHKLYGTGHVAVHAAGTTAAAIQLESVDEPRGVFDAVHGALRANGFSLRRSRVVQEERPGVAGSFYELSAPIVLSAVGALYAVPDFLEIGLNLLHVETIGEAFEGVRSGEMLIDATQVSMWSLVTGAVLVLLVGAAILGLLTLRWLDIMKRTYTIHDDVIDYTDGFLTKHHRFIPAENLTDVALEAKVAQRMLGISTVRISCQGTHTDIRLGAVPNGTRFKQNLEQMIEAARRPARVEAPQSSAGVSRTEGRFEPAPAPTATQVSDFHGTYSWKPEVAWGCIRAALIVAVALPATYALESFPGEMDDLTPLALWVAVILGTGGHLVVSVIGRAIFRSFTVSYGIEGQKVWQSFSFVATKHSEFAAGKISAVRIRRSPVDRWFGTATVSFTSVGAKESISFENVTGADAAIATALDRIGVDPTAAAEVHTPDLGWADPLRALDPPTLLAALACMGAAIAGLFFAPALAAVPLAAVAWVARGAYLSLYCRRAALELAGSWVGTSQGLLVRHRTYSPASHIKGLDAWRYVGSEHGRLLIRSGGGAHTGLGYLGRVWELQEALDARLHRTDTGRALDTRRVAEACPSVLAAVLRLARRSILSVVFIPAFLVTVPWTMVATRRIRYRLEGSRICRLSGVLRNRRSTILRTRIDHLTSFRDVFSRLTETGSIGVITLASGGTDLLVRDVRNHEELYRLMDQATDAAY